jgi:hypothetical protein
LNLLFRIVVVAAGLVFAASLAVAFVLMLGVWSVRFAWAKLTGRPVMPFIVRIDPRRGFEQMYRRAGEASRTPRADSVHGSRNIGDVTDVEPKPTGR